MKWKPYRDWSILTKISVLTVSVFLLFSILATFFFSRFFERQIIHEREKIVRNRVFLADRIVGGYEKLALSGKMTVPEAQSEALNQLKGIRYAESDYFWVNDMHPRMLMHPLIPSLDGQDLTDYKTLDGKKLFVEFVNVAKTKGEGYVEYPWPKVSGGKPVPKISYVKLFKSWNWVIGTGIYVEDIHREVLDLLQDLTWVALASALLIVLLDIFLGSLIVRPLRQAVEAINSIALGEYSYPEGEAGHDEVGTVLHSVRAMAENLSKSDKELRESREQYQMLFNRMFDGFVLSEVEEISPPDGKSEIVWKVREVNPAFERMMNRGRDRLVGVSCAQVLPEFAHQYATILTGVAMRGENIRFETRLGEIERDVEVVAFSPKHKFCAVIFTDISQRKRGEEERVRFQEQLFHTSKLASIGVLAAGVAHEINNPLSIVEGNLTLLRDGIIGKKISNEEIEDNILKQEAGLRRIANIVNGLRMFARTDSMEFSLVDLNRVIIDTVQLVEEIYRKIEVRIVLDLTSQPVLVRANAGKLQQVVMNLVSNAKDALHDGGGVERIIEIGTRPGCLFVRDNGSGIDPRNLKTIFDPFFTTKPPGTGTGLGLSLSQTLVAEMGGKIAVESALGVGSTFTISFPLITGEEAISPPAEEILQGEAQPNGSSDRLQGKVLLVDDEVGVREIMRRYLESFGLEVVEATNGEEAVGVLRLAVGGGGFAFVVTDLKMPKMGGDEVIRIARSLGNPKTKYLLITGGLTTDHFPSDQNMPFSKIKELFNADAYLKKPFKRAELQEILLRLVKTATG